MPEEIASRVLNWASEIDEATIIQASRTARMPFLAGHIALMPDAHYGRGSTVGSVIPTRGAIMPAAIGVDIGCGMIASKLNVTSKDLPDNLEQVLNLVEQRIPGGMGKSNAWSNSSVNVGNALGWTDNVLSWKLQGTAISQIGTLGGGNHFFEVCLDDDDNVWLVLHSGSRGVGNKLATRHIETAKGLMRKWFIELPESDLAYLIEGTEEFHSYITDMLWAQNYAALNRDVMMSEALSIMQEVLKRELIQEVHVNCHHNFTQMEHIGTNRKGNPKNAWITRKGAISAREGELGVIPGSMGTMSYIVEGKGNPASYHSCSHGAGRRLSRGDARRTLSAQSLADAMGDRSWLIDKAEQLVDEHPASYKDIDQVMADQQDLVSVKYRLRQILNYKGVN